MKNLMLLLFMFTVTGIYAQEWEKNYDFVDECICGLSKVSKQGKIGYVDKYGKEIIKPEFTDGLTFNEGLVAVKKKNWMYIDSTGKPLTDEIFDDAMSFENGYAAVSKNGAYGYIDHQGSVVIGFIFSNARNFTEGLAPAANAKGLWGYVDIHGKWIIDPQYGFADNFSNGEARVINGSKVFYINKVNKYLHD